MIAAIMVRTDEEIRRDLTAELKWDARIAPNETGVVTNRVLNTGWVCSYIRKWAAERAASMATPMSNHDRTEIEMV